MGAQEFRDHQDKSVHAKKSFRTNKQILALENERKKEIKDNLINSNPYLSKAFERNKKFVNQYGKTFLSYKIHQDNTYIPITVTNPYISKLKKKKDYTVKSLTIEKELPPANFKKLLESKTKSSGFFLTEKQLSQQRPQSCKKFQSASQLKKESTILIYNKIFNNNVIEESKFFRDLKFIPFTGKFKHKPIKIDTGFKTITLKEKPQSAKVPYTGMSENQFNNIEDIVTQRTNRPLTAQINIRSKLITPKERYSNYVKQTIATNSNKDIHTVMKDTKDVIGLQKEDKFTVIVDSPRREVDKYFKNIEKQTSPISKNNLHDNLFVTKGRDIEIQNIFKEDRHNEEVGVKDIDKFNLDDSDNKEKMLIHSIKEETNLDELSHLNTSRNVNNKDGNDKAINISHKS